MTSIPKKNISHPKGNYGSWCRILQIIAYLQSQTRYTACPWKYCTRYNLRRGFVRSRLVLFVHYGSRKWRVEKISRSPVQSRHNSRLELLELFIVSRNIHCALSDNRRRYDIEFKFLMFFTAPCKLLRPTDRLFLRTTFDCHSVPKEHSENQRHKTCTYC